MKRIKFMSPIVAALVAATVLWAPGAGAAAPVSNWASSDKSMLGTAVQNGALGSSPSKVWFTGYKGVVSEVFYPTVDTAQSIDTQFLVGDTAKTYVDEEKNGVSSATRSDKRSMSWQTTSMPPLNTNHSNNWKITKTVFTDPTRNAMIQRVTFTALSGNVSQYNLYLSHTPKLNNPDLTLHPELTNTGTVENSTAGRTMLVATASGNAAEYIGENTNDQSWKSITAHSAVASALAISRPWKKTSIGIYGVTDGWRDLINDCNGCTGPIKDYTMDYGFASNTGEIVQTGWIDFGGSTATSITFDVVLAFGDTAAQAKTVADATLADLVTPPAAGALQTQYDNAWHSYTGGLSNQNGTADDQYYLAAMSLKTIQDKVSGAMVAGLGTPWGDSTPWAEGYHQVWARDLFKFANAMYTAGDTATAAASVNFLFNVQADAATGALPQRSWVDGWQAGGGYGYQMDEQGMPILLAYRLGPTVYNPLWPKIKKLADYIVANGPVTKQERWEEQPGYSPSTIAAEIAGLVAAAKIAIANGDTASAKTYMSVADYWQKNVQAWTYTSSGSSVAGSSTYYFRLNPVGACGSNCPNGLQKYNPVTFPNSLGTSSVLRAFQQPNKPSQYYWVNGYTDPRSMIDGGFLELVRLGVKSPTDSGILSTIPVYDATLKQTIAGKGDGWFRYNFDGYGNQTNGGVFGPKLLDANGNSTGIDLGRGRLWPIFTAERGMYEIAKSGSGASGNVYKATVKAFSSAEGFVPEQVWNNANTTVSGTWSVGIPATATPGTATGAMSPLSWAQGEYINLVASIAANKVVDISPAVCGRYDTCTVTPATGETTVTIAQTVATTYGQDVYLGGTSTNAAANAALGGGVNELAIPLNWTTGNVWTSHVNLPVGAVISFSCYIKDNNTAAITSVGTGVAQTYTVTAGGSITGINCGPIADTQAPTVPTGLTGSALSATSIKLTWNASTDNVGVTGYFVYKAGQQIANVSVPTYTDNAVSASSAYSYTVAAHDAAGNTSAQTAAITVTTPAASVDTQAPTAPTALVSSNVTSTSLTLSWSASTDNVGVTGYQIFRNGVQVGTSTGTSFNDSGLTASTAYSYTVKARDAAGNVSTASTALSVTTLPAATTCQVSFTVNSATTTVGQYVVVSGSIAALGNWGTSVASTAANALTTTATTYPKWTGTITMPCNTTFQYKYIRDSNGALVNWESGGNRTGTTGASGTTVITDTNANW